SLLGPVSDNGLTFGGPSLCVAPSFPRPGLVPVEAAFTPARSRISNGQGYDHQDQASVDGRQRLLLRHQAEQPQAGRQADQAQVRSDRAQTRRVQGSQDQVTSRQRLQTKSAASEAALRLLTNPVDFSAGFLSATGCVWFLVVRNIRQEGVDLRRVWEAAFG